MNKPNIDTWAQDCKVIAVQLRRYAHAHNYLSDDEIRVEWNKTINAIQNFSNKYGVAYDSAEMIAAIIADSVELGLKY